MTGSMTGFGRSQQVLGGRTIAIEIKSVNHRYFEFATRMPRGCGFMEDKLKGYMQKRVSRGKIDLYLSIVSDTALDTVVKANTELAKSYLNAINSVGDAIERNESISLASLVRFPDILTLEKQDIDEDGLWADVLTVLEAAADRFVDMRKREGARLEEDLLSRLDTVLALTTAVEEQNPKTVSDYRERLYNKIKETLGDRAIEEGRLLTEVAIFSEKVAVDEETVRLRSHVSQFREILLEDEPVGRKLDFLTQELNREANTIGSKSQNTSVAKVVVDLKSELEKIREQIQNLE